jgi:hypothetical protein
MYRCSVRVLNWTGRKSVVDQAILRIQRGFADLRSTCSWLDTLCKRCRKLFRKKAVTESSVCIYCVYDNEQEQQLQELDKTLLACYTEYAKLTLFSCCSWVQFLNQSGVGNRAFCRWIISENILLAKVCVSQIGIPGDDRLQESIAVHLGGNVVTDPQRTLRLMLITSIFQRHSLDTPQSKHYSMEALRTMFQILKKS